VPLALCRKLIVSCWLLLGAGTAVADTVQAAVASNFAPAIKRLAPLFERKTGHKLSASFGATGQLYAQIGNGAPFDVLLAADEQTPLKLIAEGRGVAGSNFVYAVGALVLWSSSPNIIDPDGKVLAEGKFSKIALANPKTAPYGQAAMETLQALGLHEKLQERFVTGENIAQTQQFIASGNVALGFIALAQVLALPEAEQGSHWIVPEHLHKPIAQQALLLQPAQDKKAAQAFLSFLQSPQATAIIRALGYAPAP
jgi:molybdate transport system substrate-binding protein